MTYNAAMKLLLSWIFQLYVWLVVYPLSWSLTIVTAILVSLISILGGAQFAGRYIARPWGKIILWLTPVRTVVKGLEHIQADQSYVVVANHQSTYDILAVYGHLPLDFKWVMKIELRRIPFVGFACEKMGHIYVNRSNRQASIEAMNQAKSQLVHGTSVFFFPEGTRSNGATLKPFKKGAFRMARDLELPVLPLSISGADRVMPAGSLKIIPGTITMTFHAPIATSQLTKGDLGAVAKQAQQTVASAIS